MRLGFLYIFSVLFLCVQHINAQNTLDIKKVLGIEGYVADEITHEPLSGSLIEMFSTDSILITSTKTKGVKGQKIARYRLYGERKKEYILKVSRDGYETDYITLDSDVLGKREQIYIVPTVYLKRIMEFELDEVSVTATRLKFYHKGDTLVYNANAFRLSEGSMLDALIEQLPGAELRDNGQILVNGKKVDALLLNGKEFFKGNNQIMLDNLPNYMVSAINVYDKQGKQSEFLGYSTGDEKYVMDVKLKKQYSIGWIGNMSGGLGTKERYLGRLFLNRFTNHSQVSLYGNINNLNDNRKPGQNKDWSPSNMNNGLLTTKMIGLNYAVDDRNKRFDISGDVQFSHTDNELNSYTNRTYFLENSDIYEMQRKFIENRKIEISTKHNLYFRNEVVDLTLMPSFAYRKYKDWGNNESATFSSRLDTFSKEQLDSVFTPDFGKSLRNILLNRNIQKDKGNGYEWEGTLQANSTIKIKHTPDAINLNGALTFKGGQLERFNQNQIDYYQGETAGTSDFRNQYFDMKPGDGYDYKLKASYIYKNIGWPTLTFSYQYGQKYDSNNSLLYRLDRLSGWGYGTSYEIGSLPSEDVYRNMLDTSNSYESYQTDKTHEIGIKLNWTKKTKKHVWWIQMNLPIKYYDREMKYRQGSVDTLFSHRTVLLSLQNSFIDWKTKDERHNIGLFYDIYSQTPDMRYFVNVKNDSDPLNVTTGNSDLHNSYRHAYSLSYKYSNKEKQRWSQVHLTHGINKNAIAMGYVYNKQTGVRTIKPENVNGNWDARMQLAFYSPMGKNRKTTVYSILEGNYYHNVDFIGSDINSTGNKSIVKTFQLSENLTLNRQFEKMTIGFKGRATWSNSRSRREGFQTINALDMNYGLTAQINLPYKWQVNTDLTMYTRRGYEEVSMNTDDLVWNIRISRPFFKNRILFTVDGFDVFGQISNVTRTLNAQALVETYTNVIPSYILCHFTYRFNIQPKSRK